MSQRLPWCFSFHSVCPSVPVSSHFSPDSYIHLLLIPQLLSAHLHLLLARLSLLLHVFACRLHLFPSPFLFTLRLLATSVQPCRLCSEVCVIIFTNKSLNCSCLPQLSAFGSFYLLPCIHTHTHLIIRLLTCLFSYCFHKSIQPPTFLLPQSVTVSSLSLENKQGKTLNLVEKFW